VTRTQLAILPVLVPLVGALLQPIAAVWTRRLASPLAALTVVASASVAVVGVIEVMRRGTIRYAVGGWEPPWGIEIVLDPLSAYTLAVTAMISAVSVLAVTAPVHRLYGDDAPVYYALVLLFVAAVHGIVVSGDLFNVFVFLEVSAISSYALIASGGGSALIAAFRYVVMGTIGASFYLLGVGCLYAITGTLNMADLHGRLPALTSSPVYHGGVAFLLVGLAVKMGLFPLHGWVPEAYGRAPSAASAVIAAIGTKAAAYVVARLLFSVLPPTSAMGAVLLVAGSLAVLTGAVQAARQIQPSRLLAFSSISQIGYIAIGLGLGGPGGLLAAYLLITGDAIAKAGLFLLLAQRDGKPPATVSIASLPAFAAAGLLGASVAGVPPTIGFFAKWQLLVAAWSAGHAWVIAVVIAGSLLALVYAYRFVGGFWAVTADDSAWWRRAVIVAPLGLALGGVAAGLANAWLGALVAGAVQGGP
jgi:multicomponent Na+:H+ antiporter subunit D